MKELDKVTPVKCQFCDQTQPSMDEAASQCWVTEYLALDGTMQGPACEVCQLEHLEYDEARHLNIQTK